MSALPTGGLVADDFTPVAMQGAGDPLNAYAHSVAWFRNVLYVGTTRANLSLVKVRTPDQLSPWPTRVPPDIYDHDLRAQVLAYEPTAGTWRLATRSPMVHGRGGTVPRDIGYRSMTVYRGIDDPAPSLYVAGWASARSEQPPTLIRSRDGVSFEAVAHIGSDRELTSYRALRPHGDWLYAAATSRAGGGANATGQPTIVAACSPSKNRWVPANSNTFSTGSDIGVVELAALGSDLYAATINPSKGFSLWRSTPAGRPPHIWVRQLAEGAGRGRLNEAGLSLCQFGDSLYVGTAIQNGGYDRTHQIGPAAAELLRVRADGGWDLIVGTPRRTPHGYKQPLSGLGPGFDNPFNAYIWRMTVHDGCLYAATYNWAVFLPYLGYHNLPHRPGIQGRTSLAALAAAYGGFELWRTSDGVSWSPVIRDGFGTPYNYGGRSLLSTPYGLVVGTANPFGPEVAVPARSGWRYATNPRGGFELWLGRQG